jgi:hypothetical protein
MLNKALVMTILCSGMCYVGYQAGCRPIQKLNWAFDRDRISHVALVMTVVGLVFQYKLDHIPEEELGMQWSGTPVLYVFFVSCMTSGFALSILLILRRFSWRIFMITGMGASGFFHTIVFGGRRGPSIMFLLVIATLVWFVRKKLLPRPIIVCAILAGAFLSYNIGVYRGAMVHGGLFKGGANLSKLKEMNSVMDKGSEMRNAAYYIAATEDLGAYDFGLFHWNALVFRFFPRQVFGMSAKANLMSLWGLLHIGDNAERAYGYESDVGSTTGGITDAFASFWYFGCLEFFSIAYVMRRVYESAVRGAPVWQLTYALMMSSCLEAITHTTNHVVGPWVQAALFLGPALIYARVRPGEGKREIISAMQVMERGRLPIRAGSRARYRPEGSPMEHRAVAEIRRFEMVHVRFVRLTSGLLKNRLPRRSRLPFNRFPRNPRKD